MIGIVLVLRQAFGGQQVGDTLHVLPGDAEHAGELRHAVRRGRSGAEHLPARLGLAHGRGDRLAAIAETAGGSEDVGDDKRGSR